MNSNSNVTTPVLTPGLGSISFVEKAKQNIDLPHPMPYEDIKSFDVTTPSVAEPIKELTDEDKKYTALKESY